MQTLGRVGPYILSQFMYPPCLWFVVPAETSHRQHSHEVIPIKNSWAQPDTDLAWLTLCKAEREGSVCMGTASVHMSRRAYRTTLAWRFAGLVFRECSNEMDLS